MDKGDIVGGGQCHRVIVAPPGQYFSPIRLSAFIAGETATGSSGYACCPPELLPNWTCARAHNRPREDEGEKG